jgi:RNA polymerase sigma-70 factor (ECF subfamily)
MQQAPADPNILVLDQLLREAKAGEPSAFEGILRARQSMVFSIARHFLRNDAHAEDISQDVFLELHRNLSQIESGAHLVSWLRQVTGRKCIDQSRRVWFRRWTSLEDRGEAVAPAAAADPLMTDCIHAAMGKLSDKTRLMMILRYQEEMEPGDIAETMRVPVGTVKSTIHRGLEQMRRRLAGAIASKGQAAKGKKPWISLKTI